MITMNHHPLHTNEWFAENETVQKKNVVVGNLVYSLVLGHERARRERRGHRQPRDRVAAARQADVPRRHDLRRDQGARREGDLQGRPRHRHRRDQGHQPARRRGLLLPPQADGLEARARARRASSPTTTPPSSPTASSRATGGPCRSTTSPRAASRPAPPPTSAPGPGYPDEALATLGRRARRSRPGTTVCDLAAGTGKLTRRLVELGAAVVAVEPVDGMREQARATVPGRRGRRRHRRGHPAARTRRSTWSPSPRPSTGSTPTAALAEIARVLKPGGGLALLWNERDERTAWVAEMSRLIRWHERTVSRYQHVDWADDRRRRRSASPPLAGAGRSPGTSR